MANSTANKVKAPRPQVVIGVNPHLSKITELYIAVAELDDGEGVYSVFGPEGQPLPVVAVDGKDLNALSEYVRGQVQHTGRTVSIIGFTKRTHHETFRPSSTGDKK